LDFCQVWRLNWGFSCRRSTMALMRSLAIVLEPCGPEQIGSVFAAALARDGPSIFA
jgi:hypothetical protein